MPRRASSGISPTVLIAGVVVLAAAFFGGKALMAKKKETFAGTTNLAVEDFLENGNSLRGNEYLIEGTVDEKLRWTPDRGQVVSVKVKGEGRTEMIGVEIPPDLAGVNIEREQRYAFKVRVRQGGIPVATHINRL